MIYDSASRSGYTGCGWASAAGISATGRSGCDVEATIGSMGLPSPRLRRVCSSLQDSNYRQNRNRGWGIEGTVRLE